MDEAYGIVGPSPRSTIHGIYAEAIERARLTSAEPLQMQIR